MNQKERITEYREQLRFLRIKTIGRYTNELFDILLNMQKKWKHVTIKLYGNPLSIGEINKSEGRGIHLEILINNINIEDYDEYNNWRNNNPSTSSTTL